MTRILLASTSAARKNLLEKLKQLLDFELLIVDSGFEENLPLNLKPEEYCLLTAVGKQKVVTEREGNIDSVVIGCDTIIVCKGKIIGKQESAHDAKNVLLELSNNTHSCFTGVSIQKRDKISRFVTETRVTFTDIDHLIDAYLETGEWKGKAGAYGIQAIGGTFVSKVDGCFYNVVGVPLSTIANVLMNEFNFKPRSVNSDF